MRAFIFSLDAFVAFTLALIAIYSLIFFSSVPSSYYYLLTQGHYLSRDVLMALSTTPCSNVDYLCTSEGASLLDNIASQGDMNLRKNLVQSTVGRMVPVQFGYTLEAVGPEGGRETVYDTAIDDALLPPARQHATARKKLSISSEVMTFGYSSTFSKPYSSVYNYLTCNPGGTGLGGLVTCGEGANKNPTGISGADLVPSATVKILRLTIFI
jgi:hypothetical protein